MRAFILVAFAGCTASHPPDKVALAPPPRPIVPDAFVPPVAPAVVSEEAGPTCDRFVIGAFESEDDLQHYDGEGGRSWDQKRDELEQLPDAGTCDIRHRGGLEADLAKLAAAPSTAHARAWDRKTPLAYAALVRDALALTPVEEKQLARDGFVVPDRLAYDNYSAAFYDIHRGQLPVYVSADAILHSVYASHDELMGRVESARLVRILDRMLGALACGLPGAAADYPPEVARDLDVYLAVARSLLASSPIPSALAPEDPATIAQIAKLTALITDAGPRTTVELFGRERAIDPNLYTPRGHYANDTTLTNYFRAAMWLSRVEMNLVSRDVRSSDLEGLRTETPREDVAALALADLVARTDASADLATIDRAWTLFAGKREDVSIPDLAALRATAHIAKLTDPDAAAKLRAAIGDRFQRTINTHPNKNVQHLPAIATLLGPRITSATDAVSTIVSGRGPDAQAVDLGAMLGIDRATAYTDPKIAPQLARARTQLAAIKGDGTDLYTAWLAAIRAYGPLPTGAKPSFMESAAFGDLRLDTAIVAFAQLTHNHVLVAAQVYDQGGCEIPDGYVEPAVAMYRALATYATRGSAVYAAIDPKDASGAGRYFARLGKLANTLAGIATEELAGHPLSDEAKRFLAMIVEMREATAMTYTSSYPVATYDGWYIDLFPSLDTAFHTAAFVADYLTYERNGKQGVKYLAATGPHLGIFAVDTGGGPRMMVGPVAHGFQVTGPIAKRFTDEDAAALAQKDDSPWTRSYRVPVTATTPQFAIEVRDAVRNVKQYSNRRPDPNALAPGAIRITASRDQGAATLELLDHHFVRVGTVATRIGAGQVDLPIPATARPVEAVRVVVGQFTTRVDLSLAGHAEEAFGGYVAPPPAHSPTPAPSLDDDD